MSIPYPFDRVRALVDRAVVGVLTYAEEVELRALLAREQPLALTWDWATLIDYGKVSIGWHLMFRERDGIVA